MIYDSEAKFEAYLSRFCKKNLADLEKKFNIRITWDKQDSKVILIPKSSCNRETFLVANEEFVAFYQDVHKNMTFKRFFFERPNVEERNIISNMSKKFPVYIERSEDRKQWLMYGEAECVDAALVELNKESHVCLEPPTRASADDTWEDADVKTGANRTYPGKGRITFQKILPRNVKISVCQGDITEEDVEAIVNAANDKLDHIGGVALAISRKGGPIINRESKDIVRRKGRLQAGKAVSTKSGNLPCRHVIHAVGPQWFMDGAKKSKKILRKACMNSLKEAEELEVDSIALPAIGSGVYSVPKDVCAEVMFDAVEEYSSKQASAQGFSVTDVRFVNIDDDTVKVFRDEFIKRYGSSQGTLHPLFL